MALECQRTAFITGVTGQDGAYLAAHLLEKGWRVYGGFRRGSSNKIWRLEALGITRKVNLIECQLSEPSHLIEILRNIRPDHVYNLAGESFVADSFKYPTVALEANTLGTLNLLDALRLVSPNSRFFSASSSEIFGYGDVNGKCDEGTLCRPTNPYGVSKLAAQNLVRIYRESYGLFACSGILFNHESQFRGREYVTRKITFNIARLKVMGGAPIELGDFSAGRDWGAASDYVRAMYAMLRHPQAKDFVVASGRLTTVRDFLQVAALAGGFEPSFEGVGSNEKCIDRKSGQVIAQSSKKYFRPRDSKPLVGDASLLILQGGWRREIEVEELIKTMVDADIRLWKTGQTNV